MANIIIPGSMDKDKNKCKNCPSFKPFEDGTLTGDPKYCWWSFACVQSDMQSDYVSFTGRAPVMEDGKLVIKFHKDRFDYMCTGIYGKEEDKGTDKEIS